MRPGPRPGGRRRGAAPPDGRLDRRHGRLAYLGEREVEPLRLRLLALAERATRRRGEPRAAGAARRGARADAVPTGRLIASILISDVGLFAEARRRCADRDRDRTRRRAAEGLVSGGIVWILAIGSAVWRRFNSEYRLTVAESADGLHVRSGLIGLTAETIRPGRVQAVRMVEPLLWRPLGWCRLEVDVAGRQRSKGEGQAQRGRLRAVLPVG